MKPKNLTGAGENNKKNKKKKLKRTLEQRAAKEGFNITITDITDDMQIRFYTTSPLKSTKIDLVFAEDRAVDGEAMVKDIKKIFE